MELWLVRQEQTAGGTPGLAQAGQCLQLGSGFLSSLRGKAAIWALVVLQGQPRVPGCSPRTLRLFPWRFSSLAWGFGQGVRWWGSRVGSSPKGLGKEREHQGGRAARSPGHPAHQQR